jgi:Cu(I)/Ag(I) efflux system membrane fusion protein
MKTTSWIGVAVIVVFAALAYGMYEFGVKRGKELAVSTSDRQVVDQRAANSASPTTVESAGGRKILYWQDPMAPGQRFDKPGKSPYMDMQLVPVYADSNGDETNISIDPRVQQNLGVRTVAIKQGFITSGIEAVGSVAYNERDVVAVQARANGFLERLYVRAPLDPVRKGQALAEIYVPEWVAAQEEYLTARRIAAQSGASNLAGLVDGAKQRMRLSGMSDDQIQAVEAGDKVRPRLTLTAPIGGVVGELMAREGMTVMSGAPLFRLNGLSTVWVNAEIPEGVAARLRPGALVEARAAALPGETFKGKVGAILPEVSAATRTIKARIELANPGGRLVPGMFATVSFAPTTGKKVLLVPTEAVIQTGRRSVVIVAQGDGRFSPVDVEVGLDNDGQTEIRKGLQAGQNVVVSGQFLLDSEANLKAATTRMREAPASSASGAPDTTHRGNGVVESIDNHEIMLSHGPIPTLGWPAMTMGFMLPPSGIPAGIAIGDRVNFEIRSTSDGKFQLESIERAPATPSASQARAGAVRASGEPAKPGAHDPSAHGASATEPASPAVKP